MKRIVTAKFIVLGFAALVLLNGCDDDKEKVNDGLVSLLSFGPSGIRHGETVRIIGYNLGDVTSIVLPPAIEISSDAFASQSSELIEVVIPEAAEEGTILLKTSQGDIVSKTVLSFNVPVLISSFTEQVKPGTNMTITGEFVNWIRAIRFPGDVVVTNFVSESLTELVVMVPMEAKTGPLAFVTGGTEPLELESEEDLVVTLPAVTSFSPDPIERGGQLTITGTDLDLVKAVEFKGNVTVAEADFISRSASEIVLVFPVEGNKGTITLVTYSNEEVESEQALSVVGDLPPLAALALPIYTDALSDGWEKWGGWGGATSDIENADNVRDGEKAIKADFVGSWGAALQLGGTAATDGHTHFVFYVFGDSGTGGKQLNVIFKNGDTPTEKIIDIVEDEWTEVKFSVADDLSDIPTITEFSLQDRGWSGTLYIDHIGFR